MTKKYIWLHDNLDRYTYNTDKARELLAEFKSIEIADKSSLNEELVGKLKGCYDRFVKLFNNNPFSYRNGLEDRAIETGDFDCYFVSSGGDMIPIELYKVNRPVESVLLLSEKLNQQKDDAVKRKEGLVSKFGRDVNRVGDDYKAFQKSKKPRYFRALLATIACLLIVWYFLVFLNTTNIFDIIKSIGDGERFVKTIELGMMHMPFMRNTGVLGWIILWALHIFLLVKVVKNLKFIKKEFSMAYQNRITASFCKTTNRSIDRINTQFQENFENDVQTLLTSVRQGNNCRIDKSHLGIVIKLVKSNYNIAKEFLKNNAFSLRGIEKNSTIAFLVAAAIVCHYTYSIMDGSAISSFINDKIHQVSVKWDTAFLRAKKLAVVTSESDVYKSYLADSPIEATLPAGVDVEVTDSMYFEDTRWLEIKKITDTEVIKGWVPASVTVPLNDVNYDLYEESEVPDVVSSSYLIGARKDYLPEYAIDWNTDTSWQDGNEYSSGEGEYLTLNFADDVKVDMIQIFPGNGYSEELFYDNERVRRVKIEFSNGKSVEYEFEDDFDLGYQTIWLNKTVETDYIYIEITDVYDGEMYQDVCISEVHVFSKK